MKKLLAIILAVAMICSVFVGCNNASDVEPSGNSNNTPNETASNGSDNGDTQSDVAWDTSKKDEIIVTVVNGYYTAGERALAEAYMELHPETKVTIDVVSDNDAYFAKMQAIFSGDSLDGTSDIVHANFLSSAMGGVALEKGYLRELTDILDMEHGQGHINDTYCVVCQPQEGDCVRFILQGLSMAAFPHPEELMENMIGITSYLREKIAANGGDTKRETLSLVKTKDGKDFFTDSFGKVWRLTHFVEGTDCFQSATPELFEASVRTFGRFQHMLQDYPAETLHETIVKFHDTEDRFRKFLNALKADKMGRADGVREEVRFVLDRKADCSVALQALRDGKLPLRVTHNDTKLNNILIDRATGEGVCVIDLDTTMPGLSINDFGDSIRFGANHSAEDEKDLSKVNFDIELYEVYTRGFLEGAQGSLTEAEVEYLPWGARLMTLECGIRFLTDYLEGDRYFHIRYPEQNLDRCRTQFKLVRDMEEQFEQMAAIVQKYTR